MKNRFSSEVLLINDKVYAEIPKRIKEKLSISPGDNIEFGCGPYVKIWNSENIDVPSDIFEKLMDMFKTEDYVFQWLNKKKKCLLGKAPITILSDPAGKKEVLDLINRIQQGDFS